LAYYRTTKKKESRTVPHAALRNAQKPHAAHAASAQTL
jgi:hypothetical protein